MTDKVIEKSLTDSWESGVVAVIIIGAVSLIFYIVRKQIHQAELREQAQQKESKEREDRLATRITNLETFVEQKLLVALENSTSALNAANKAMGEMISVVEQLTESLHVRPCFLDQMQQQKLLENMIQSTLTAVKDHNTAVKDHDAAVKDRSS